MSRNGKDIIASDVSWGNTAALSPEKDCLWAVTISSSLGFNLRRAILPTAAWRTSSEDGIDYSPPRDSPRLLIWVENLLTLHNTNTHNYICGQFRITSRPNPRRLSVAGGRIALCLISLFAKYWKKQGLTHKWSIKYIKAHIICLSAMFHCSSCICDDYALTLILLTNLRLLWQPIHNCCSTFVFPKEQTVGVWR